MPPTMGPVRRIMPRRIIPRRQVRIPVKSIRKERPNVDKELDETIKKLKEMSK